MKKILFFMIFVSTISCAGADIDPNELETISFMPTQCSEVWDEAKYTATGANRGSRITSYLSANGITALSLGIENDGKMYCQACTCPSGDKVTFKVTASDFMKLKALKPFDVLLKGE
jgi:hypothetical protein